MGLVQKGWMRQNCKEVDERRGSLSGKWNEAWKEGEQFIKKLFFVSKKTSFMSSVTSSSFLTPFTKFIHSQFTFSNVMKKCINIIRYHNWNSIKNDHFQSLLLHSHFSFTKFFVHF